VGPIVRALALLFAASAAGCEGEPGAVAIDAGVGCTGECACVARCRCAPGHDCATECTPFEGGCLLECSPDAVCTMTCPPDSICSARCSPEGEMCATGCGADGGCTAICDRGRCEIDPAG
jgi:hypothetical protein